LLLTFNILHKPQLNHSHHAPKSLLTLLFRLLNPKQMLIEAVKHDQHF
jgi:hypothetical protein